jgi:hypothetical protein
MSGADDEALAIFRIGIAISVLIRSASYWLYLDLLHGEYGLVQKPIAEVLSKAYIPTTFAIDKWFSGWGFDVPVVLEIIFFMNFLSSVSLLLGSAARFSAISCWISNAILMSSANVFNYGVDDFQLMGLFYCSVFPVDRVWSLRRDRRKLSGWPKGLPIWIIRIHICIVYFSAGLWKISGEQWWDGTALWLALLQPMFIHPPFSWYDLSTLAKFKTIFSVAGMGVVLAQLAFPFLVFVRAIRPCILSTMIFFHICIGLFLGLQLFSFTLIIFDIAAFYDFSPKTALRLTSGMRKLRSGTTVDLGLSVDQAQGELEKTNTQSWVR